MGRKGKTAALLAALCLMMPLLVTPATAENESDTALEDLQRSAGEYAPQGDFDGGFDWNEGIAALAESALEQLGDVAKQGVRSGVVLLVIVLLCALTDGVGEIGGEGAFAGRMAGVLAIWTVAVRDVNSLMTLGQETMELIQGFTTLLLPTLAAASAAAGTPAGAAARQMATVLFSDALMALITKVLIPLTYAYITASAVNAALSGGSLKRVAKTLKGIVTGTLTTVMVAFVGYLSISGVVASGADAISVKTAKMAISGMVPVVGGVLSDAAETVLAGAGTLKNTVGVFGMLVVLGFCLTPFLRMGAHYLVYKLSAALSGAVVEGPLVELIDQLGGAFGLMLGMTGCGALLLLISILSCLNAAGVT